MSASVCGHVRIRSNGDNTGIVAAAALNVADSEGTIHEGICNISVARVGGGAVNLHRRIAQQILDVGFAGFVGLGGSVLFPHGVQGLRNRTTVITGDGLGHNTGAARLTGRATAFGVAPALEYIARAGGNRVRNVECMALGILIVRSPGLIGGGTAAAVGIILQREVPQIGGAASAIGSIPVNPICHRTSAGIGRPLYGCSGLLIASGEVPVSGNLSDAAKLAGINKVCKWGNLVVSTLNLSRFTCTGDIRTDVHRASRHREHVNLNRNGSAACHNRADRTIIAVIIIGRRGAWFRILGRIAFLFLLLPALVHYVGRGLNIASPCRILCQRSRRQKSADHEHCQKQTEKSAQTMFFHHEILSFHSSIRAAWHRPFNGNASITYLVEL